MAAMAGSGAVAQFARRQLGDIPIIPIDRQTCAAQLHQTGVGSNNHTARTNSVVRAQRVAS
eukprot:5273365-Lingulodinium_polyedra.AAC.1